MHARACTQTEARRQRTDPHFANSIYFAAIYSSVGCIDAPVAGGTFCLIKSYDRWRSARQRPMFGRSLTREIYFAIALATRHKRGRVRVRTAHRDEYFSAMPFDDLRIQRIRGKFPGKTNNGERGSIKSRRAILAIGRAPPDKTRYLFLCAIDTKF